MTTLSAETSPLSAQQTERTRSRNSNTCDDGAFRQVSVMWPHGGGTPYLHLCDEEHGHRLLSLADSDDMLIQTEATDAVHLREALLLLSRMVDHIESVNA